MKRLLILTQLLAAASLSFGQGYVGFFNSVTTRVQTNGATSGYTSGPVGSWYYALLVAPSTQNTIDPSLTGWTFAVYGTNTALPGRMYGNTDPYGSGVRIPGFSTTATADFAVVAWSGNLGSDFSAVYAGRPATIVSGIGNQGVATWLETSGLDGGWYGISTVANDVFLSPAIGPYGFVWGQLSVERIQGMTLNYYTSATTVPSSIVPEPSALALAGLGAASLLIFRRRK